MWLQLLGDVLEGKAAVELRGQRDALGSDVTYKKVVDVLDKLYGGESITDRAEDHFQDRVQRVGETIGDGLKMLAH